MNLHGWLKLILLVFLTGVPCLAQDKIELKTIQIKGNKELPKILYVVPWQDATRNKDSKQRLKLHNFFGDLYQPLTPAPPLMAFDEK